MYKNISKLIILTLMSFSLVACFHDETEELLDLIDELGNVVPRTDVHGDTQATATVINNGGDSGAINTSGDIDMFSVVCANTCTIAAGTGGTTDTVGRLLDSNGTVLIQDDDSGSGSNFSFALANLDPDTYFVEVSGFGTAIGAYTISVSTF